MQPIALNEVTRVKQKWKKLCYYYESGGQGCSKTASAEADSEHTNSV
jgi:hypothetical protein